MAESDESNKYNKLHACRTCLVSETEHNVLLNGEDWFDLLEYCVGLNVKVQDEPHKICRKCADIVSDFVDFKVKCLATDSLWKSITSDNMDCLINNYTTDIEKEMKNQLQNFYDIIDTPHKRHSQKSTQESKIKEESQDILYTDQTDLLDDDHVYLEVLTYNDNNNCDVKLYTTEDKYVKHNVYGNDDKFHATEDKDPIHNDYDMNDDKLHAIGNRNVKDNDYNKDEKLHKTNDKCHEKLHITEDKVLIHKENKKRNCVVKSVLKCKKCKKVYGRQGWLKMHMKLCGKTSDERKVFHRNKKNMQGHICGLCSFTSASEEIVSQHFKEHCARNDLKCQLCEFVGTDFADMVSHRLSHDSKAFKVKQTCPACKKKCASRLSMQFHYRSAHLNKKGGYCSKCDIEFTVYKTFNMHVRAHNGKKFVCDFCGQGFLVRNQIIEHMNIHTDTKNYICHECGKRFRRHNSLLHHMRTVHVKDGPLKCTHCNKMFKNLYTLNKHRKVKLGMKNSLKCEFCGKCFASPHLLRSHRFWHTDERPHCCEICGSRYKAKGQLKVHMLTHTGSKPFECSQCVKCFATGRQLKRHASVHTGVRPHKCLHCDRTFYSKKQMLNHCASRHKDSEVNDEIKMVKN